MKSYFTRLALPSLAVLVSCMALSTQAHAGNMQDALDQLESARRSQRDWHVERAIEHLASAKQHLEDSGNPAPERVEGIRLVRKAIATAKAEDWDHMTAYTKRAITLVREVIADSNSNSNATYSSNFDYAPVRKRSSNMREALDLLESARQAHQDWRVDSAVQKLQAAKRRLELSGNTSLERAQAIDYVREAVDCARGGEWHRTNDHIRSAIRLVRDGIERS